MADFCNQQPELAQEWAKNSNSIIILTVPDERALYSFIERTGLAHTEFREPDFGYDLTAIALHPSDDAKRYTSSLPLAMKKAELDGLRKREMVLKSLVNEMHDCEQAKGMSILDHGWSVRNYARDLIGNRDQYNWKIPEWFPDEFDFDLYTLDKYTIFHDCGKPNCRTVDEDGKHHFYNHADISSVVWESISDDKMIKELIARDMEIHTIKAVDLPEFKRDIEIAKMLTVVGLAELHSNADMFGGIESVSFKIKYKHWCKRAKRVFNVAV